MPLDPSRTVAELRELQELTADADGAQRVAWTDTWVRAKEWLAERVPLEAEADQDELRTRRDADGNALPDVLAERGVDLDRALEARKQLENAAAYLELHIEQGPVLESLDLPLGVVLGTFGVERHQVTFRGQAAHAGSTPMDKHLDATWLAEMLSNAEAASRRFAHEEGIEVEWEKIWSIEPIPFDDRLLDLADESVREVAGSSHRLPSGPLHDAAEVARAGIPTVMLFVQSLRGLSHTKLEDTKEEHLELSVRALDRLTAKALEAFA